MAGRQLAPATSAALDQDVVYSAWIFRLDIKDDPVQVWTGPRNITPAGTADGALNGITFEGMGTIGDIGQVVDGKGGSQALVIRLPGVDLEDDALKQVVKDKRRWQFRQAWVWIATLNGNYEIVGEPFRVKTGRMDKMNVGKTRGVSFVSVTIESHQAYASEVANTKYSELKDFDPSDTSQNYVHDLANRQAIIGGATANNPTMNAAQQAIVQTIGGRNMVNQINSRIASV